MKWEVGVGNFGLATTDIISQLGVSHSCHEVGGGGGGDFGVVTTDIISQLGVSHSCHEVGDGGRLQSRDD